MLNNNNFFSVLFLILQASDPIVRTKNGQVRGQLNATVDAKTPYYAFRGIPYAKPPIGDLRFRVRKTL